MNKNSIDLYRRLLIATTKEKIKKCDFSNLHFFEFGNWAKFGVGAKFGDGVTFGVGAKFGDEATFGDRVTFSEYIYIMAEKFNYLFSAQNLDGSKRQIHILLKDNELYINAGCFLGNLKEFINKAKSENKYKYVAFAECLKNLNLKNYEN